MKKNIRKLFNNYWEDPKTVSIIDKNLHEIEIDLASKYLMPGDSLADIGCGDGEATIQYAKKVKKCIGFDKSNLCIKKAKLAVLEAGASNTTIKKADILKFPANEEKFDVVIAQRLLINLASWREQKKAISNIHRALKPGGRYIMIENTNDGFTALNEMRAEVGLGPIPQHWHNRFFDFDELSRFLEGKFQMLSFHDLGLYYFLTRVYTQMFASFKGFGATVVKDPIFDKSDKAARVIFEKFQKRIRIEGQRALGPIQIFVFRREE